MSIVLGTFSLTCNKCGKQHDFTSDEADFDTVSISEAKMDHENNYTWEHNFDCGSCGNKIEIEYDIREYPNGIFNKNNLTILGGKEVKLFSYGINDIPDSDNI